MNSPAHDIKDILEGVSSLGLTYQTDLFIAKEVSSPIDCVTLFDIPGGRPDLTMENDSAYFYCSVNVRVRNTDYDTGYALISDIKTTLHGIGPVVYNGTRYMLIECVQEPSHYDYDENGHPRFIATFNLQRQSS